MSEQTTIPNWPSLWEREPAMRPGHGGARPDYGLDFRAGTFSWTDETVSETTITDHQVGLALCRDAAVRWLGALGVVEITRRESGWAVLVSIAPTFAQAGGGGPTIDEAIFKTAEWVLGARASNKRAADE